MKAKMFVLGLPKFKDDNIVFSRDELESMNGAIGECLQKLKLCSGESKRRGGYYVYSLDPKKLCIDKSSNFKVDLVELGYYHHRAIVNFSLDLKDDFYTLREVRKELKKLADDIINLFVKERIKKLVRSGKVRKRGKIEFFYTYPLIIVEKCMGEDETTPFSEQTTTLCFEIFEPSWWGFSAKRHVIRISVPSTILYHQKEIDESLLRDVINGIYHHFLYERLSQKAF